MQYYTLNSLYIFYKISFRIYILIELHSNRNILKIHLKNVHVLQI